MIYRVIIMKKTIDFAFSAMKITAVLLMCGFCILRTDLVSDSVSTAVSRCVLVIIPSLFAMMTVSRLIVKSGIAQRLPKPVSMLGKILFGMEGNVFAIFLFSQLAGFPVGASMLASELENGRITKRQAEICAGFCFGAGPAFIFGCISSKLYGSNAAGKLILCSAAAANLILALIMSVGKSRRSMAASCRPSEKLNLTPQTTTDCILAAGRSIADICIMITAFSVISSFLSCIGATGYAAELISRITALPESCTDGIFCAILDVSDIAKLPVYRYDLLPIVCALVSFGGICVILQVYAVIGGRFSIAPMLAMRIAAAALSAAVCRLLMPFFLSEEALSAAEISVSVHSAPSPIPSLLLILMTLILFRETERLSIKAVPPVCDK